MQDFGNLEFTERNKAQARVSKETWEFLKHPLVSQWAGTIETESTRLAYAYRLMLFLQELGMSVDEFVKACKADPDNMGIKVDGILSRSKAKSGAQLAACAMKSLLTLYRVRGFEITYKFKRRRVREKRPFSWEQAEQIINECQTPYREVFRFMLYGALDQNSFTRINWNEKLNGKRALDEIAEQMKDHKGYVKINLPPRKSNVDRYFILVPKQYVPRLPATTRVYARNHRGGKLIAPRDMDAVWQRAAERTGIYYEGLGPHHVRTAFSTKCGELGIPVIGEWQMGHGGDRYGYDTSGFDEQFILNGPNNSGGLMRLWESKGYVDKQAVTGELEELRKRVYELEHRGELAMERQAKIWQELEEKRKSEPQKLDPDKYFGKASRKSGN